jgi:hypothetical protein
MGQFYMNLNKYNQINENVFNRMDERFVARSCLIVAHPINRVDLSLR